MCSLQLGSFKIILYLCSVQKASVCIHNLGVGTRLQVSGYATTSARHSLTEVIPNGFKTIFHHIAMSLATETFTSMHIPFPIHKRFAGLSRKQGPTELPYIVRLLADEISVDA